MRADKIRAIVQRRHIKGIICSQIAIGETVSLVVGDASDIHEATLKALKGCYLIKKAR